MSLTIKRFYGTPEIWGKDYSFEIKMTALLQKPQNRLIKKFGQLFNLSHCEVNCSTTNKSLFTQVWDRITHIIWLFSDALSLPRNFRCIKSYLPLAAREGWPFYFLTVMIYENEWSFSIVIKFYEYKKTF